MIDIPDPDEDLTDEVKAIREDFEMALQGLLHRSIDRLPKQLGDSPEQSGKVLAATLGMVVTLLNEGVVLAEELCTQALAGTEAENIETARDMVRAVVLTIYRRRDRKRKEGVLQ